MALKLMAAPAVEPVTLEEAKAQLRIDGDEEDALLATLITVARLHIERSLDRCLITQSWAWYLDAWPRALHIALPMAPVQAVTAITTFAVDDAESAFDADDYFVDADGEPARVVLRGALAWPTPGRRANGIKVAFTAGYGDTGGDVPAPLRQALLMLVAHWQERREPVALDAAPLEVPATVAALLAPYRRVRL